jgi:hypothetical protein
MKVNIEKQTKFLVIETAMGLRFKNIFKGFNGFLENNLKLKIGMGR